MDAAEEPHSTTSIDAISAPLFENNLPELLFLLGIKLCEEEFTDGKPYSTTLMYVSGILGFTKDGIGFQRPHLHTPVLSALMRQQILLFLEFSLPYRPYVYL